MARVKRERDRFVGFVLEGVDGIPGIGPLRGHARFVDDQHAARWMSTCASHFSARRDRHRLVADASRQCSAALGDRLVVNDDVFDWDDLPASVAVFGPGVIGLELGQALHPPRRAGPDVRPRRRVGPLTDPAVRDDAVRSVRARSSTSTPMPKCSASSAYGDGVAVRYRGLDGRRREAVVDYVLAATGRAPNVRGGSVSEHTGTRARRPRRRRSSTGARCSAGQPDLHRRRRQRRPAAAARGGGRRPHRGRQRRTLPAVQPGLRRTPLGVVFTDPQIAMVGRRFAELDAASS